MLDAPAAGKPVSAPEPGSAATPRRALLPVLALLVTLLAAVGCGDSSPSPSEPMEEADAGLRCSSTIPEDKIFDGGVGRDGIPALADPETARPGEPGTEFLASDTRVVGVELSGRTIAVPHNILWYHEVVNFDFPDRKVAVTFCPLTGSTLIFDRSPVDGQEFLVSGLLLFNNLIMVPKQEGTSLFPQMSRGGRCGPLRGTELPTLGVKEMTWAAWKELHPETEVVSSNTGFRRSYGVYPYGNYNELNNRRLITAFEIDDRRPPKERVIGIPAGRVGGVAIPFGELEAAGPVVAVRVGVTRKGGVLFWREEARGAVVYRPVVRGLPADDPNQGRELTFETRSGEIRDAETGSAWTLDGRAVAGPLEGARLEAVQEAFPAFWFAWALFQPETEIMELRG